MLERIIDDVSSIARHDRAAYGTFCVYRMTHTMIWVRETFNVSLDPRTAVGRLNKMIVRAAYKAAWLERGAA